MKYLEQDKILDIMCACCGGHRYCGSSMCNQYWAIKRAYGEDVVPVVHGHWVVDEDGNIKCSECGHRGVGDNYCERCGARMDRNEG